MATTRERILLLQENRIEQHIISAILDVAESDISHTLRDPSFTPPDPGGAAITLQQFASAQPFVVRLPEEFGAKGVGLTHDDSTAVKEAIEAAVQDCIANHSYYCEVWFSNVKYGATHATHEGGATEGNAQIPLPLRSPREPKVTIVLRGVKDASALGHWHQTEAQLSGAVIQSNLTGLVAGDWGAPSIIGGPTEYVDPDSGASFSNLLVVVDGLALVAPLNPGIVGFDFLQVAEANVPNALTMVDASLTEAREHLPTNTLGIGLRMPSVGNNDNCNVGNFTCVGFNYGVCPSEHFNASRLCLLYNSVALVTQSLSGAPIHGGNINYMSVEGGKVAMEINGDSGGGSAFPLNINILDAETQSGEFDIIDANHGLRGNIGWAQNEGLAPKVSGAARARIIDLNQGPGKGSAPSLVSGTSVKNPFWRDAWVSIKGATKVELDGEEQSALSGVIVPSGKSIKVTGSELAWQWTKL